MCSYISTVIRGMWLDRGGHLYQRTGLGMCGWTGEAISAVNRGQGWVMWLDRGRHAL